MILLWILTCQKNSLKYSSKSVIIARKSQLLIIYLGSNVCKKCTNARLRHVVTIYTQHDLYGFTCYWFYIRLELSLKLLNNFNIRDCWSFSKLFVINLKGLIADWSKLHFALILMIQMPKKGRTVKFETLSHLTNFFHESTLHFTSFQY